MNSNHRSNDTKSTVARTSDSSPVIDLVTLTQAPVFDWPRLLLTMGTGAFGLLLLVCLIRFLVVVFIQSQVEAQLEYLAHWIGLRSINQLTWVMTFSFSALLVKPTLAKMAYIASGGMSRLHVSDWILMTCGAFIILAMPTVLEYFAPVSEIDPATEQNWFYIDRIVSQTAGSHTATEPPGRLGYVREDDGSLKFYNIPMITRPSDGAPIFRVTREIQKEWQRLREEKAKREQRQRDAEEADRRGREALRQSHEQRMAELRAQAARAEAERQSAQKAEAEAALARAEAEKEKTRLQAEAAERHAAAELERQSLAQEAAKQRASYEQAQARVASIIDASVREAEQSGWQPLEYAAPQPVRHVVDEYGHVHQFCTQPPAMPATDSYRVESIFAPGIGVNLPGWMVRPFLRRDRR
jgi:hypothetical protein